MLLSDAHAKYLEYMVIRKGAALSTIKTYRPVINKFIGHIGDIETSAMTNELVDMYAEYLASLGLSLKTIKNKLDIIRSFVRYLYGRGYSDLRPERIDVPRVKNTEMTYLVKDEAVALLEASRPFKRDYAMLATILSSGVRVSELCALKIDDIMDRTVLIRNGKGGKTRCTFISSEAKQAIDTLNIHYGYVFPNKEGAQMSRMSVLKVVKKYVVLAGIKKRVGVHTLRHTFATMYLEDGGKLEDLQQLLGHTNIQTTLLYLHFTGSHLKNAYETVEITRKSKLGLDIIA